ncbi:MAG: cell division ATP-binding protein FtsE [Patescibacteria group bacterium]|nr:cell division ATP-binding protein FtsE [Patescibacteria group bacterium]
MLEIKNLSKSYGNVVALNNVSFDIKDGEFVFLTGHSGAGKTTLLRLLLRQILPDSGQIIFDGVDIVNLKKQEVPKIRQRMGVVFQDFKILPERTVRENIEVALAVINLPKGEWKARVNHILDLVELSERADFFPAQLSGGELQRVAMARALVVNPKIILADEPTGNLDWVTAEKIISLFDHVNKEGKTVIIATHNQAIVAKMKKRVIELKAGEIVRNEYL